MMRSVKADSQTHQLLLTDNQKLLDRMDKCQIEFNYREANKVADILATVGKHNLYIYQTFFSPPPFALGALCDDAMERKRHVRWEFFVMLPLFFK